MKRFSTLKTLALAAGMMLVGGSLQAQDASNQLEVTVPETGYLAIKPAKNFTGPAGVYVCSMFGSNSSGLSFTTYNLGSYIIASSSNSSSGLFLVAKPGKYTLTLTDEEATGKINSTSVSWQDEPGQAYKKNRRLYKFVNESGRVGFVRDEKYALDNYQYCDLAEGEHIYLPLAENNVTKIAELLNTDVANLDFIPWKGPWNKVFTVDDIQPTEATFDFTKDGEESLRGYVGTAMADVKGYIYNETYTIDNVSLQITAGSAPSRIYKDNNKGINLVMYKEYTTMTFKAPEGYAITKIAFELSGGSKSALSTESGTFIDGANPVWEGNAEGVRFLETGTGYFKNAVVTLAAKDGSTTALPAIEYTECANIAAFNALATGSYAKVTLTNAEVIGKSADGYSTVWIQDATGGCWIQYTSLNDKLQEKTKVNGYVYVVARPNSGNVQMKEAEKTLESVINAETISDYTIVEGTLADLNVPANLNKVVKITDATLEETSATAGKLTQGEASINVNNGTGTANQQLHKIADWAKDKKLENITIVGILVATSATDATKNQILPISISDASGITDVNAANAENMVIYNLQGVRLNQLQKGLNIVNGKKVVMK